MKDKKIKSREKIEKAALWLFTKKGIYSTRTKEIAKRAGVAEGTIYIYFKSKDELAYSLFTHNMNQFREILVQAADSADNADQALNILIETFYQFAIKEPVKYEYIIIGHHTELEKMPPVKSKPKDAFVGILKEGMQKGTFRDMDPNIAAAYIIGMITRSIMFYKNDLIKCDYDTLISETRDSARKLLAK